MCWIAVKSKGVEIPTDYMDRAQEKNSDGYGVSWYEDKEIKTYKTFNYKRFKGIVATLKDVECIVHLRNNSVGTTDYNNIHPMQLKSGYVMYHNGTIYSLKGSSTAQSDTSELADILDGCKYNDIKDIAPLLSTIVGTTYNKLVFMGPKDGKISILNKSLGIEDNSVWYSSDYHIKKTYKPMYKLKDYIEATKEEDVDGNTGTIEEENMLEAASSEDSEKVRVFVYGTLKKGCSNHSILNDSLFLGTAVSFNRWQMISGGAFPYVIKEIEYQDSTSKGEYIKGEVYEVSPSVLDRLDLLEGYPYHYKYNNIDVILDDEESSYITALVYVKTNHIPIKDEKYIAEWSAGNKVYRLPKAA